MRQLPRSARSVLLTLVGAAVMLGVSTRFVQAATYSVTITESAFVPASFALEVGDTIEFRNSTTSTQSAKTTLATGFNTGDIGPNQAKSVTVTNPGTFTFSSAYNAALTGTAQITAADTTATGGGDLTTTSTASGTKTGQPVQTQPQPVSGVFEVVVGMTLTGILLVGGGTFWQRRLALNEEHEAERSRVTSLPTLTWKRDQEPPRS